MTTVKEIADEIVALQSRKNADYGNAFGISMQEFGLTAPAIRLTDKLNRFKSLIKKDAEVKTESIEDTLIDLAAYAMMTIAEMRNGKKDISDEWFEKVKVFRGKIQPGDTIRFISRPDGELSRAEFIEYYPDGDLRVKFDSGLVSFIKPCEVVKVIPKDDKKQAEEPLKAGDEVELIGNDIIGENTGKIYALKGDVGDIVCVEGDDVFVNFRESHWQVQLKTEQVRKI